MKPFQKIIIVVFLLIALAIRLHVAFHDHSLPEKDALNYDRSAMSLVNKMGYRSPTGEPTAYRVPLYPMFLASIYAVAGHSYRAVRIVQAFVSTLTVLLIALWAWVLFGGQSACWAAAIAALYPPFFAFYFSSSSLLSETLFTFFFTATLFTIYLYFSSPSPSWWVAVISGLSWGLAILTRPVPAPLLLILPLLFFLLKYPIRQIVRYHLWVWTITGLVLTPWIVRNYLIFKTFIPFATEGGTSFYATYHPGSDIFGTKFYGDVVMVEWEKLRQGGVSELEREKYFYKKGMDFVRSHPQQALQVFLRSFYLYLDPTNTDYKGLVPKRSVNWGYIFVAFGSLVGFLFGMRNPNLRPPFLSLAFIFGYLLLFHAAFHTSHRYRLPTEPILILMTSFALAALSKSETQLKVAVN